MRKDMEGIRAQDSIYKRRSSVGLIKSHKQSVPIQLPFHEAIRFCVVWGTVLPLPGRLTSYWDCPYILSKKKDKEEREYLVADGNMLRVNKTDGMGRPFNPPSNDPDKGQRK